ncbi:MAG TPA: chloride channel protein [Polyangiaceae bacterium]|nr:chloride channel protein [Polyangiaceae bacterium]
MADFAVPGQESRSPRSPRFWTNLARFALAILVVSLGAAVFAILFRSAIGFVFVRLYRAPDVLRAFAALPWYASALLPAMGGALAGVCGAFASHLKGGAGVGQVMEAVVLGNVRISLRLTSVKALGSWLAIVSGGSVGREGSIIQFGGGLGVAAGRLLSLREGQVRSLVAAGSAAGFAAAYNTPLAAVLFVSEVVTGVIALDIVLPAIVATPIATAVTRLAIGGGPIYGQHTFRMSSDVEILVPGLLGLLAGVAGPAFMLLLSRGETWFGKIPASKAVRAALGGLLVGLLAIRMPEITGNGYEAINLLLAGRFGLGMMALLAVAKAFATTASVSSGSPGGVFTPSLFIGAALGGIMGHVTDPSNVRHLVEGYALIGMAAMTASTTHAPVMAAVMVFELSGDYAIVLPLLIATALATLVARRIRPLSIYGEELQRHGMAWDITIEGRKMRTPPS